MMTHGACSALLQTHAAQCKRRDVTSRNNNAQDDCEKQEVYGMHRSTPLFADTYSVLVRSRPMKQGCCYFCSSEKFFKLRAPLVRFIRALSTSASLFSHSNCPSSASFASPFRTSEVNRSANVRRNNVHPKLRQKKCRSCRRRCHVDDLQRVVGHCLLELDGGRDNVVRAVHAVTRIAPRR